MVFDLTIDNAAQRPFRCPAWFVDDAGIVTWLGEFQRVGIKIDPIGQSRAGRPLYGLTVGEGPLHVSITAGAHADEPAGPMAASALALYLSSDSTRAQSYREQYTFYICPQVNPDGAQANSPWFAPVPDAQTYLRHVKREGPGDDIEFGYPGNGKPALRPENEAVASFLRKGAPYVYHASLHSMGFAEGAWFLIEESWVDRSRGLREELAMLASRHGFRLHDIQRNGDKGFSRIERGFCTTPTSTAMQKHFQAAGDPGTASKFHLSSMEFIQSLGGDPLCMVSEIPNFAINGAWEPIPVQPQAIDVPAPAPGSTAYEQARDAMKEYLATTDIAGAIEVTERYSSVPIPFATHISLQIEMVLTGVHAAAGDNSA